MMVQYLFISFPFSPLLILIIIMMTFINRKKKQKYRGEFLLNGLSHPNACLRVCEEIELGPEFAFEPVFEPRLVGYGLPVR